MNINIYGTLTTMVRWVFMVMMGVWVMGRVMGRFMRRVDGFQRDGVLAISRNPSTAVVAPTVTVVPMAVTPTVVATVQELGHP